MSSGEVRKVSRQEIQLVQNLIERCLQLYMSQKEVVDTLLVQAKIEPGFTELVWQKLEEENQEFFREYYLRLVVKDQIVKFNSLLARQVELMHQTLPAEVASIHLPNGSPIPAMHQNSALYAPEHSGLALQPANMHLPVANSLPNAFINGGSSLDSCMQTGVDMPTHAGRIDVLPNLLLAQNSNVGIIQGANGGMLNSETGYVGSSQFMFGADGNVPEMCPAIGDASVSSFGGGESNSQQQNGTLLDSNSSLFGFLGRIPRNLSLTDLTADFSNSSDIFDYSGSPFLAAETDNFFNNHGRGEHQGDVRRLETVPECLNYGEFGNK